MNKKIYFGKQFILITTNEIQPSENQQIVTTGKESPAALKNYLENFIQQTQPADLILQTPSVSETFKLVKSRFISIEAAGGLIRNNDRYLFIFRLGKWDLPKGKLEPGEAPRTAAVRECEEECGIDGLTITSELAPTCHIYPYQNAHALKTTYWYAMQSSFSKKLVPQIEENIERAEWLNAAEIKAQVLKNTYPAIAEVIKAGTGI